MENINWKKETFHEVAFIGDRILGAIKELQDGTWEWEYPSGVGEDGFDTHTNGIVDTKELAIAKINSLI